MTGVHRHATLDHVADHDGWYYCLRHQRAEPYEGCRDADRLGPYPDRETASRALDIAKERTEAADAADREWNGD